MKNHRILALFIALVLIAAVPTAAFATAAKEKAEEPQESTSIEETASEKSTVAKDDKQVTTGTPKDAPQSAAEPMTDDVSSFFAPPIGDNFDAFEDAWIAYSSAPEHQRDHWTQAFASYSDARGAKDAKTPYLADAVPAKRLGDGIAWMVKVPLVDQEERHWCGPAAATMAVGVVSKKKAKINNLVEHLGTDDGGTDFGPDSAWPKVLKKATGFHYQVLSGPVIDETIADAWSDALYRHACATLLCGRAAIIDTVQFVDGIRLPGYERYLHDTWHYLTLSGFDATDPAAPMLFYNDPNGFNTEAFGMHALPPDDIAQAATYGLVW